MCTNFLIDDKEHQPLITSKEANLLNLLNSIDQVKQSSMQQKKFPDFF